ncbi:MBL fold metallo-hydrolase [Candidatus Fermentibacteria bacterium]|nr:MAG: MBL fold metallo-hydrolase [Candidatus Fermentibacteria bacterium]
MSITEYCVCRFCFRLHSFFEVNIVAFEKNSEGVALKLTFHGAAGTVTGSQHLLEANGKKILLDCGLFQGRRQESERLNREYGFEPASVDAVILSHAHIDHSGKLPGLVKNGFRGVVYATAATRDLAAIMLPDSAHIQKADTEYINRKRAKEGLEPVEPLYDLEDALEAIEKFVSLPYGLSFQVAPGIMVRFLEAGHILGSSQVELTVEENGKKQVILFTGDLGRFDRPILRNPDLTSRPDVLITESTYGGRNHDPQEKSLLDLEKVVNDTVKRRGKIIIPAFSVGRTQEVLYFLNLLFIAERIPRIPVFVDSPLSFNATEVFKLHPEVYDSELRDLLYAGHSPFDFENLHFVQSVSESKAINTMHEPMIVLSASGMCENGRIRHHLKNNITDPANTIVLVGYMAENTLGRRIRERRTTVNIFGVPYPLNAAVENIDGFSAHADSDGLIRYFKAIGENVRQIAVVHGEPEGSGALAESLGALTDAQIVIPAPGESITPGGTI